MGSTPRVVVLIPTYNERENILHALEDVMKGLVGYDGHVVVVDDGSPDGTGHMVEGMAKEHPQIYLISRPGRMGLGSAYVDGMRWAFSSLSPDVFVQMDADLSHPPQTLPTLIQKVLMGCDVVLGSRYVDGGEARGWPWYRRRVSWGANLMVHLLLHVQVKDATSGFRALNRRATKALLAHPLSSRGYAYQIESLLLYLDHGLVVKEVPIIFTERRRGRTKLSFSEIVRFAFTILRMALSKRRMVKTSNRSRL